MTEDSNPITITIDLPHDLVGTQIQGEWIPVNLTKMPNNALVAYICKGVQRMHNDAANQLGKEASTESKRQAGRDMVDRFYQGDVAAIKAGIPGLSDLETAMAKEGMAKFKAAYGPDKFKVDFRDVLTAKRYRAVLEWLEGSAPAKVYAKVKAIAALQIEDDDEFDMPDMPDTSSDSDS